MSGGAYGWMLGLAAHASFLVVACIAIRLVGGERRLIAAIGAAAVAIFAVWALLAPGLDRVNFWSFASLYLFLYVAALQAFGVVFKSISLRMLSEIAARSGGTAPFEMIYRSMVVDGAYARRLQNLETGGLLTSSGGLIRLTRKGEQAVRIIVALQRFLGIRVSG